MKMIHRMLVALLTMLLMACSPHPGTGHWVATGDESIGFSRLHVTYEGRTNMYGPLEEGHDEANQTAIRRCFWRGVEADVIELTCVQAANTDIEEQYELRVDQANGMADLTQGGRVVGRYLRNPEAK